MNIVNYKGTNLRVSDIALGGGVLGSRISDQASFDILDCFVGNGGTFIDTANVYGRWNIIIGGLSNVTVCRPSLLFILSSPCLLVFVKILNFMHKKIHLLT